MALSKDEIVERISAKLEAEPDPSGQADLVCKKGSLVVVASPSELKVAFSRLKSIETGYRWIVLNRKDLFSANPMSVGSKVGIMDPDGSILKAADLPRKRI